jgi:hypothetical protein
MNIQNGRLWRPVLNDSIGHADESIRDGHFVPVPNVRRSKTIH